MINTQWSGRWIGVDLDGTLAHDEPGGPYRSLKIGPPIPEMLERVRTWLESGMRVKIMTARMCNMEAPEDREKINRAIQDWTEEHLGVRLEVTNEKDYDMLELYDDRAVQVERNTGRIIGHSTRGHQ